MTEMPKQRIEVSASIPKELLGRNVDFQERYTSAVTQSGLEVVHRRDPLEPRDILCMDEGLQPPSKVTVRLAGPVPLLARTRPTLIEKATEGFVFGKVYDHESCGALGLNLAALGQEMSVDQKKAGAIIVGRFARDLTASYDNGHTVEYGGRLELTRRPKDKHTGQIVYYDARESGLDPAHIENFDPGYTVSRGIFGPDASREYTGLALTIAFGDHGLGGDLTPDTPLHLVGIADSEGKAEKISDELSLIQNSRGEDAERIQVHVIAA